MNFIIQISNGKTFSGVCQASVLARWPDYQSTHSDSLLVSLDVKKLLQLSQASQGHELLNTVLHFSIVMFCFHNPTLFIFNLFKMFIDCFTKVKKGFANPCVGPGPVSSRSGQPLSGLPDPDPGHSLSLRPRPEAVQGTGCPVRAVWTLCLVWRFTKYGIKEKRIYFPPCIWLLLSKSVLDYLWFCLF